MKSIIIALLFTIVLMSTEIFAQSDFNKNKKNNVKFSKVESTRIAIKLAHYGYEYKSATALIAAAEILIKNKITDLRPSDTKINKVEEETKNSENIKMMLNRAIMFANGDKELIAMADKIKKGIFMLQASRGVIGGARVGNHQLAPNGTNSFWVMFKAKELAEVSVIGTGNNVIKLHVYDEKGSLIKKDIRHKAECYVNWEPQIRSAYKIEIKNNSDKEINYSITTN
ncbi:MAG: hypothetical protein ABFS35_14035 [Bacteroidota bacterium]